MSTDPITSLGTDAHDMTWSLFSDLLPGAVLIFAVVIGALLVVWAIRELT